MLKHPTKYWQKAALCPNTFKVECLGEVGEANICTSQWDVVCYPSINNTCQCSSILLLPQCQNTVLSAAGLGRQENGSLRQTNPLTAAGFELQRKENTSAYINEYKENNFVRSHSHLTDEGRMHLPPIAFFWWMRNRVALFLIHLIIPSHCPLLWTLLANGDQSHSKDGGVKRAGTKWTPAAVAGKGYLGSLCMTIAMHCIPGECEKSLGSHRSKMRNVICISDCSNRQPQEEAFHLSSPRRLGYIEMVILFCKQAYSRKEVSCCAWNTPLNNHLFPLANQELRKNLWWGKNLKACGTKSLDDHNGPCMVLPSCDRLTSNSLWSTLVVSFSPLVDKAFCFSNWSV